MSGKFLCWFCEEVEVCDSKVAVFHVAVQVLQVFANFQWLLEHTDFQ